MMNTHESINQIELQEMIVNEFPSFIAFNYQRVLQEFNWKEKTEKCIRVFDYTIRALTLIIIGQYLFVDRAKIQDPVFDKDLKNKFPRATLGEWVYLLFKGIQIYRENNIELIIHELVDISSGDNSDTSKNPMVKNCFSLVETRNEIFHGLPPQNPEQWEKLFFQVHGIFIQIFHQLRFLTRYNLILIKENQCGKCAYQIYRGTRVEEEALCSDSLDLQKGWFYLSPRDAKHNQSFLKLYPFIFGFERDVLATDISEVKDSALLNKFTRARIHYLATVAWQNVMIEDDVILADFFSSYSKVLDSKNKKIYRLEWNEIIRVASQISLDNINYARYKFDASLYSQRGEVQNIFLKFIYSQKNAFILLGKSGVGKTSFLISQIEDPINSNFVYLFYEGKKLDPKVPVADIIANDFLGSIQYYKDAITGNEFFSLLDKTQDRETNLFIILIDAINENESAKNLLEQINIFLEKYSYPWLKVIISSRPEAWKVIKKGIRLSDSKFFQMDDDRKFDPEISPFYFSSELKPFSKYELPHAYKKYQDRFNLKTTFDDLSVELREVISEPLILKLIGKMYCLRSIPGDLKEFEILQMYIEYLLKNDYLRMIDIRFLENEIMPRMLSQTTFNKAVQAEIIQDAITESNQPLFDLIHNDGILSTKQRVNQSYFNLADAEILVISGTALDYELGFKYEKFFDYFAGRRILKLVSEVEERKAWFFSIIEKIRTYPFLWGAVKYSLIQEIFKFPENVIDFCNQESQLSKDMMVAVLTEFGRDYPNDISGIIENLVPHLVKGKEREVWMKSKPNKNAWKIAIEVASRLKIHWVLLESAAANDAGMRPFAIQYSYLLWRNHPQLGFEIIEGLTQKTFNGFPINLNALESAIGLSLIIFFEKPNDQSTLINLQMSWKKVIAKFLGIKENSNKFESIVRPWIMHKLFSSVLSTSLGILGGFPNYNILTNFHYLENSVNMSVEERKLYINLLDSMTTDDGYHKRTIENDLIDLLDRKNLFLTAAAVFAMCSNLSKDPNNFLSTLKLFFAQAESNTTPNAYLSDVPNVLEVILDHNPKNDEIFDFFVYSIQKCQQYYLTPQHRPYLGTNEYPQAMYLGPYVIYQYFREGTVESEWLNGLIEQAFVNNDVQFFTALLKTQLIYVGIERRYPHIALNTLRLFFNRKQVNLDEEVRKFLSKLRIYYPDLVDDFLEEQGVDTNYSLWIKMNEPEQRVGELVGIRLWLFVRDDIISGSESLRSIFLKIFRDVAYSRNLKGWVNKFIRELVNLIYGSPVF